MSSLVPVEIEIFEKVYKMTRGDATYDPAHKEARREMVVLYETAKIAHAQYVFVDYQMARFIMASIPRKGITK